MSGPLCTAVAFDLVGTLFRAQGLRRRLWRAGLPLAWLPLWIARSLQASGALEIAGGFVPFEEVAAASLEALAAERRIPFDRDRAHWVTEGFGSLNLDTHAGAACHRLEAAGVRFGVATYLGLRLARRLLERAGLGDRPIASAEDLGQAKPAPEVYRLAALRLDARPQDTALISAHAWDIHGAYQAGLLTVWLAPDAAIYHPAMHPPHLRAADLEAAVAPLLHPASSPALRAA